VTEIPNTVRDISDRHLPTLILINPVFLNVLADASSVPHSVLFSILTISVWITYSIIWTHLIMKAPKRPYPSFTFVLTQQWDRKPLPAYDVRYVGPNKRLKIDRMVDLEGSLMVLVLRDASVGACYLTLVYFAEIVTWA
jgi:hypothetical protein